MKTWVFLLLVAALLACGSQSASRICPAHYALTFLPDAAITLDGRADESAWGNAAEEACFFHPWENREGGRTTFRAVLGAQALYFFFGVEDSTPVEISAEREEAVAEGDRVEVFFALDDSLDRYYCLEISPSARVFDYSASYYRQFESAWDLDGLEVVSQKGPRGYTVEGAIPRASLVELGFSELDVGNRIMAGIFRADFEEARGQVLQHWISWCLPPVRDPDFHISGAFGFFEVVPAK